MTESGKPQLPKRLYSIGDAAVYLGCSYWTLAEKIRTGLLPYVQFGEKRKLVDIRDLDAFITKNKRIESI